MTTTSLKLSDELKQRAASAAQVLGISTHAFMVDAIRQAAHFVQQGGEFVEQALAARTEMLNSQEGFDANDVRAYLRKRVGDKEALRPGAKPWRK